MNVLFLQYARLGNRDCNVIVPAGNDFDDFLRRTVLSQEINSCADDTYGIDKVCKRIS